MQNKQLERLKTLVLEKNQHMNLTAITDPEEFKLKHIQDSLIIVDYLPIAPGMKIADLGTGAGFPGLPLAIVHPDCEFHLMDSVNKKLRFVSEAAADLGLNNVHVHHGRFEDLAHQPEHREQYDLVVARAVAPLPVLLEYMAGFVTLNGQMVAYKSQKFAEELAESEQALKQLHIELLHTIEYDLAEAKHILAVFGKRQALGKEFPRKAGTPSRNPL